MVMTSGILTINSSIPSGFTSWSIVFDFIHFTFHLISQFIVNHCQSRQKLPQKDEKFLFIPLASCVKGFGPSHRFFTPSTGRGGAKLKSKLKIKPQKRLRLLMLGNQTSTNHVSFVLLALHRENCFGCDPKVPVAEKAPLREVKW